MSGSAAQRAVEMFRAAVPQPQKPALHVITIGVPARRCGKTATSWVESYQAQVQMARAYLEATGLAVTRLDDSGPIPRWLVTGQKQSIGNDELILLAKSRGMA